MTRTYNDVSAKIRETIVEHMPKDAEITRIEFEGPRLAIYVRNVNLLSEQSYVVTEIVNLLHKRIVIRSDQSIRLPEREAEGYIRKLIPKEAEVTGINFDPSLGEVVAEAKKPGVAIGKEASVLQQVIKETRWRPRILRAPPLHSKTISMTLHQLDYLDVHSREGEHSPFEQKDVREVVTHTIPLRYNVVTDVAPDIKLTLHNAGHILGSSIVHLHIGEGLHNIVYSADFKFGRTMMLDSAMAQFPRAETLIIESTYGGPDDIMPDREGVEGRLVSIVNETVEKNGKVLIPVPAVGRAQEIMLVLDAYMRNGALRELPIYIEGMVNEATAIHTAFPEYLVRDIKEQILHQDLNPFQSEYFHPVTHPGDRDEIVAGGPCVIIATSGMLEGGPAIDYFRRLAPDPRNTLAYVSYQVEGTLGNRIKNGLKEVSLFGPDGKIEMVKCDMRVESIEGFSGHSDRNQLLGFIKRMMPKPTRIIVNHGERRKSDLFAQNVNRIFGIKTVVPDVLESLRLR